MTDNLPLDQLGAQARAHISAGDKAKEKSEQHYIAAGLYLKEALEKVSKVKGLNWTTWLQQNVEIGKSRSYELIAIADGRKTVEEVQQRAAAGMRQTRAKQASEDRPSRYGQTAEKPQQKQQPEPERDFVKEARRSSDDLLSRVLARVQRLSNQELEALEQLLQSNFGQ